MKAYSTTEKEDFIGNFTKAFSRAVRGQNTKPKRKAHKAIQLSPAYKASLVFMTFMSLCIPFLLPFLALMLPSNIVPRVRFRRGRRLTIRQLSSALSGTGPRMF